MLADLEARLARFQRLGLAHLPTPLEPLPRLTEALATSPGGGPNLWSKRDDCTGLAGGGNKTRKLEYLLGDALANDATTLITQGAVQSNHVRQTAAAAALFGMACESAYSKEKLIALNTGDMAEVGPWKVTLAAVEPVAGPNWTALEAQMQASYAGGVPRTIHPQSRSFWTPPQQTTESALVTRWNGQLYAVLGNRGEDGRWQVRLWWKPFVTLIWLGGIMIALGGLLALIGRVASDLRRMIARDKIAYRRARQQR